MNGDTEERLNALTTVQVVLSDGTAATHPGVDRFYISGNGTLILMGPHRTLIHAYATGVWAQHSVAE